MKPLRVLCLFVASLLLSGCASNSTTFTPAGAPSQTVGQVEFYDSAPARPHAVLGVIEDHRGNGLHSRATLAADISARARAAGGDAVVLLSCDEEIKGYATTDSLVVPIKKIHRRYQVLKWK